MAEKPKSPAELEKMLKDMESMSKGIGDSPRPARSEGGGGGALKSLLGFFVKIHDDDEETAKQAPAQSTPVSMPVKPANQALPTPPMSPVMVEPPTQRRVSDLVANEALPKFNQPKATAQQEDLSAKPFEEIYKEAGVFKFKCSIDELVELMNSPTVASQPLSIKVVAVNLALTAKGVKLDDYIADAVRKDRALDAYQLMLNERASEIENKAKADIESIQKEVEEYLKKKQQEMEKLRTQASEASRQAVEFAISRQVEEQRLADTISPFLEGKPNPVSIGNTPERS